MTKRVDIGKPYREDSTAYNREYPAFTGRDGYKELWQGWEESGRTILNMASEQRTEPASPVRLRQVPPVIAAGYEASGR